MSHLLSAFIERPASFRFESQQPQEEIVLLLRAHPITTVRWIVITLLIAFSPLLFFVLQPVIFGVVTFSASAQRLFLLLGIIIELVAFGYAFEQFLDYYFSVYFVTNIRIVDIDFINLLSKKVSEAQIKDIEDVTYTQTGIIRSIFNYGDVTVQTAGIKPEFHFYGVPKPSDVTQVIAELQPPADGSE